MRQFLIQNQYGEQIQLQGGSVFLWEPEGLGFEYDIDFIGTDGFFIETYREVEQVEKNGTLVFKPGTPYQDYRELMSWILSAGKLTLGYNPDSQWFYVNVAVSNVEKSELNIYGLLEVPITFMPLTPWYTPYNLNLTIDGEGVGDVKRYIYSYPYRYSNSARAGVLDFTVQAQMPCDFELEIPGLVQNPVITATRLDTDEVIGVIDLSQVSADTGETLKFSTVPSEAGAFMLTTSGIQDLTAQLGLSTSTNTFFRIPPNVPIEFALTATSLLGVQAFLTVYRYYMTV